MNGSFLRAATLMPFLCGLAEDILEQKFAEIILLLKKRKKKKLIQIDLFSVLLLDMQITQASTI